MPYRCIKPACEPMQCCMCNCAVSDGDFETLLYCYHCGRPLNEKADPSTAEVEPQTCQRCAETAT